MLTNVQNNTKQQTFGNYTTTILSKRASWLNKDIKLNANTLKDKSEGYLSIFKTSKNGVYCYSYPLNKNKFLNYIFEKLPQLKLLQNAKGMGYESSIHGQPAVSALTDSINNLNKKSI